MKKTAFIASFLTIAIVLGFGLALVIPQDAYACECAFGYPPASYVAGTCPKDPNLTLIYWGCTGRYVCPPYNPCHCSYKGCYKIGIPHEEDPDPEL